MGGGSRRVSVSPFQTRLMWAGEPMSSGHSGWEAGCFSRIRVSHASATMCLVTGPPMERTRRPPDHTGARDGVGVSWVGQLADHPCPVIPGYCWTWTLIPPTRPVILKTRTPTWVSWRTRCPGLRCVYRAEAGSGEDHRFPGSGAPPGVPPQGGVLELDVSLPRPNSCIGPRF